MTEKTLVQIKGIIKKKLPDASGTSAKGKAWTKRVFIIKQSNGEKDVFVTTFSTFDNSLIGKEVELNAEHNPTYNSYALKGDIKDVTPADVAEPVAEEPPTPKPKPRKKATTPAKVEEVVNPDSVTADSLVEENLTKAEVLLKKLGYAEFDLKDVLAVADMVGRTKTSLNIEAGKNKRMAGFKR